MGLKVFNLGVGILGTIAIKSDQNGIESSLMPKS